MNGIEDVDEQDELKLTRLFLARGADIFKCERQGNAPLHEAAKANHELTAKLLVPRGAAVDARNKGEETPLFIAAASDSDDVVQVLIEFRS